MTAHAVFIIHRTRSGRRADAQQVWDRLLRPAIEANPDHLAYTYTFALDDPDVIRAFQLYSSREAAAAFLQTAEYCEYASAVDEFLDGPPEVLVGADCWTKERVDPKN